MDSKSKKDHNLNVKRINHGSAKMNINGIWYYALCRIYPSKKRDMERHEKF